MTQASNDNNEQQIQQGARTRGRHRQRITLDIEHARLLHLLWIKQRQTMPSITKSALVEDLILEAAQDTLSAADVIAIMFGQLLPQSAPPDPGSQDAG